MSVRGAMYSLCQPRSIHSCTDGENNTDNSNNDNHVIVVCDDDNNNDVRNNSLIISHKLLNTEMLQPSDFLPVYNPLHYLSEFEPDIFEDPDEDEDDNENDYDVDVDSDADDDADDDVGGDVGGNDDGGAGSDVDGDVGDDLVGNSVPSDANINNGPGDNGDKDNGFDVSLTMENHCNFNHKKTGKINCCFDCDLYDNLSNDHDIHDCRDSLYSVALLNATFDSMHLDPKLNTTHSISNSSQCASITSPGLTNDSESEFSSYEDDEFMNLFDKFEGKNNSSNYKDQIKIMKETTKLMDLQLTDQDDSFADKNDFCVEADDTLKFEEDFKRLTSLEDEIEAHANQFDALGDNHHSIKFKVKRRDGNIIVDKSKDKILSMEKLRKKHSNSNNSNGSNIFDKHFTIRSPAVNFSRSSKPASIKTMKPSFNNYPTFSDNDSLMDIFNASMTKSKATKEEVKRHRPKNRITKQISPKLKLKMKTHLIRKNDDSTYTCQHCQKIFKQRSQWKRHVDCVHLKLTKFTCIKCSKGFKRSDHLKNHIKRMHNALNN